MPKQAKQEAPKHSSAIPANPPDLTIGEITSNDILKVRVDGIPVEGQYRTIRYRPLSTDDILTVIRMEEDEDVKKIDRVEHVTNCVVRSVVNTDGSPMFTRESIGKVAFATSMRILNAIVNQGIDQGNESSETDAGN